MEEIIEDCLIALYIVGEGEKGFDQAHLDEFGRVAKLIRKVRKEMREGR